MTLLQSTTEAAAAAVALRNALLAMHAVASSENPPLAPGVGDLYSKADDISQRLRLLEGLMGPETVAVPGRE